MAPKSDRAAINEYIAKVGDPEARKTLKALRAQLHELLPGAVETIYYRMPTLQVDGESVISFAWFGKSCGVYPFSGSVIPKLSKVLEGYTTSKSGVTFPPGKAPPKKVLAAIVRTRLEEIAASGKKKAPEEKAKANPRKKSVGQTASTGFQVGVIRTLPMRADALWTLLTEHPERWLGDGAELELSPGEPYEVRKRRGSPSVRGEIRVVKPNQRLRMTWQPEDWQKPATLQLTVVPKAKNAALSVHMEKLPSAAAREEMRVHWAKIVESLAAPRTSR